MKKLIVSGALLGLAATPALAADMKIYGQAHLAGSYLDNGASGDAEYSALNISSNSSYLGFRANYDFNEHLRGIAQIEGDVNFDGEGNDDISIYSRNTFLGLGGAWGEVKIGRMDTPLKVLRSRVDLFGNQVGDARNVMDGSFDKRFKRSILYTSPTFYGLTADLHYSTETEEESNGAVDGNDNDAWSASLTYRQGPLYAAVAYEQWNNQNKAEERDATRVAVSYNIADVVRITGFAHFASYEQREDANTYGIGVRYALTPQVALKAQYYTLDSDANNADADLIAVGVDYQAAKNLRFYLNYAQVSNDENTSLAPWRSGSTLKESGVSDETAKAVAVGAILSF